MEEIQIKIVNIGLDLGVVEDKHKQWEEKKMAIEAYIREHGLRAEGRRSKKGKKAARKASKRTGKKGKKGSKKGKRGKKASKHSRRA